VIPAYGEPSLLVVTGEPEMGGVAAKNYGEIVQEAFAPDEPTRVPNAGNKSWVPRIDCASAPLPPR
jgi:hypothetical protein